MIFLYYVSNLVIFIGANPIVSIFSLVVVAMVIYEDG